MHDEAKLIGFLAYGFHFLSLHAARALLADLEGALVEFGAVRHTATPCIGASTPLVAALVMRTAYPEGSPFLA
jgi:hypothetical protein